MRLQWFLAVLCTARLAKVVETLEDLGKSLREESFAGDQEFKATKAACSAETDEREAVMASNNETLKVLTSASEAATARVEALDQSLLEKNLEVDQIKGMVETEMAALKETRSSYKTEQETMEASKEELEKAIAKRDTVALAATGSLRRLRKLSTALTKETFLQQPPSFVQLSVGGENLEASLDAVRHELEELRGGLDASVKEHETRLQELKAELLPLERDTAKLVPSRANAEAEKSGAETRATDLTRSQQRHGTTLKAHADFCAASLASLSAEAELRAEVQNALAGAAETLQSSVFTSLVETSAAALEIPTSFVQTEVVHRTRGLPRLAPEPMLMQTSESTAVVSALRASQPSDPFGDVKGRIRGLIDDLRKQRNGDVDMQTWCNEQEGDTNRDEFLFKDEVDVEEATSKLHAALEQDCKDSAAAAEEAQSGETQRANNAAAAAGKAAEGAAKRSKDHELAKEVVAQAQTLVRELFGVAEEAGAFLQNTPSQAGKKAAAETALTEIKNAEKGLVALVDAHKTSSAAMETKLEAMQKAGKDLTAALKQQAVGVDVLLSGHQDARLEAEEAKRNAEASLESLTETREQQKQQCVGAADQGQDSMQRRQEEIASLQDAAKVLDGESVPVTGLVSLVKGVVKHGKLSALDAAAQAMGISVRDA